VILPQPSCPLGYTLDDLMVIFPLAEELDKFFSWMRGQTGGICEGRRYDYEIKQSISEECASTPHGMVIYKWDVQRYIDGGPIVD